MRRLRTALRCCKGDANLWWNGGGVWFLSLHAFLNWGALAWAMVRCLRRREARSWRKADAQDAQIRKFHLEPVDFFRECLEASQVPISLRAIEA